MKAILVLGLLAGLAIVAPVATADICVYTFSDAGLCRPSIVIPGGAHAWISVSGCPYVHPCTHGSAIIIDLP